MDSLTRESLRLFRQQSHGLLWGPEVSKSFSGLKGEKRIPFALVPHSSDGCISTPTTEYQDAQPTIVLVEPHRELVPNHVAAPGIKRSFFAIGTHMMHGAGGSLWDGDPILLAKVVHIAQPSCTIGLGGFVRLDLP